LKGLNMLSRRNLLKTSAFAVPAVALAGCVGATPTLTVANFSSDANLLVGGLETFASTTLQALLPAAAYANVQADIKTAENALNIIEGYAATVAEGTAQPVVTQIVNAVNSAVATIKGAGIVIPADVTMTITALEIVLPSVESAVGLLTTQSAAQGKMTLSQARAVLPRARV
jgi:hypothetical protein